MAKIGRAKTTMAKIGLAKIGLAKVGQIRIAKTGLAKVGPFREWQARAWREEQRELKDVSIASVGDGTHNNEHNYDVRRGRDALSAGVSGSSFSIAGYASQEDVLRYCCSGWTAAVVQRVLRLERSMLSPKSAGDRVRKDECDLLGATFTGRLSLLRRRKHSSQNCWLCGDQDSCRWCLQSRRRRR